MAVIQKNNPDINSNRNKQLKIYITSEIFLFNDFSINKKISTETIKNKKEIEGSIKLMEY
jgi:hypothetical protein